MNIDEKSYYLNTQVLEDVNVFDSALDFCEELATQTLNRSSESEAQFEKTFRNHFKKGGINSQTIRSFYEVYTALKTAKEKGRDSIWKFIVQNLYKPYFLANKFDYVVGNPPWFTFSSIKNNEYQDTLEELAGKYHVKPKKIANFPHLEIAAIFLAYCSTYFLKQKGKIAFVLPRSFFAADHHDNSRGGVAKGFKLSGIWDLKDVSPLFRIPSCVMFADQEDGNRKIPESGIPGYSFEGNLPVHNCNLAVASSRLTEYQIIWHYSKQGKATALTNSKGENELVNPYKAGFRQGATIVPRSFYFVELAQEAPPDWKDRIVSVRTSQTRLADAKKPWNEISFTDRIESHFLFRTAIGKTILPFAFYNPDLVVLPITIDKNKYNQDVIALKSASAIRRLGFLNAARWFANSENIWKIYRTEKNGQISSEDYLNWQNKLTEQNLNVPYLLLYNGRGADACATVVTRTELDLPFLVDHALYWAGFYDVNEAHYLAAILNSSAPNKKMKDYQSSGLFGARNIHKKILDIFYPKFSLTSKLHKQIAALSIESHDKASKFLVANPPIQELSAIFLGRMRTSLKKHLDRELTLIDELVLKLIT